MIIFKYSILEIIDIILIFMKKYKKTKGLFPTLLTRLVGCQTGAGKAVAATTGSLSPTTEDLSTDGVYKLKVVGDFLYIFLSEV